LVKNEHFDRPSDEIDRRAGFDQTILTIESYFEYFEYLINALSPTRPSRRQLHPESVKTLAKTHCKFVGSILPWWGLEKNI
jgi:hypothetical protein